MTAQQNYTGDDQIVATHCRTSTSVLSRRFADL